jgi:hypothetical protein
MRPQCAQLWSRVASTLSPKTEEDRVCGWERNDMMADEAGDLPHETAALHPEEMRATFDLTVGRSVSVKATARATPAGLVSAALLMSVILIPLVLVVRSRARRIVS